MSEMDYSDEAAVEAALVSAAQADSTEQAPAPPAPVAPEGTTPAPVQPPAETPEVPAADTPPPSLWDGTAVNPDTLPAELQPLAKQLQAAFTQKTQGLAEERKQWAALGTPEEVSQAVELYSRISDPTNWPQLHSDLSTLMEQYGLTPAEAAAEAAATISDAQAAGVVPTVPFAGEMDPELAPLYQALQDQAARIDSLTGERQAELTARQEAEQSQRLQDALLGEMTRQENAILQAHPEYDQADMEEIFELSSFYGGNLLNAERAFAANNERRIAQYIASKGAVADAHGAVAPAAAAPATPAVKQTFEEAAADAEELFRQLQANGELGDF